MVFSACAYKVTGVCMAHVGQQQMSVYALIQYIYHNYNLM
jgi:hypothetical protein